MAGDTNVMKAKKVLYSTVHSDVALSAAWSVDHCWFTWWCV